MAGLKDKVTFVLGDVINPATVDKSIRFDAAFLDPDWAVTGDNHQFRFRNSNTQPPADKLLDYISGITPNFALVLPPLINPSEFNGLPEHEMQRLYIDNEHVLLCLYFGDLKLTGGATEYRA